jgi:hypothetical protein
MEVDLLMTEGWSVIQSMDWMSLTPTAPRLKASGEPRGVMVPDLVEHGVERHHRGPPPM